MFAVKVVIYKDKEFTKELMAYEQEDEDNDKDINIMSIFVYAAVKTANVQLGAKGWRGIEISELPKTKTSQVMRVGRVQ